MQLQGEGEEAHPPRSAAAFVTAQPGPTRSSAGSAGARRREQMEPEGKAASPAPGRAPLPARGAAPAAAAPPLPPPRGRGCRASSALARQVFSSAEAGAAKGPRGAERSAAWRAGVSPAGRGPRGLSGGSGGRPVPAPAPLQVCEGPEGQRGSPAAALGGRCPAAGPSSARSPPPAAGGRAGTARSGGARGVGRGPAAEQPEQIRGDAELLVYFFLFNLFYFIRFFSLPPVSGLACF